MRDLDLMHYFKLSCCQAGEVVSSGWEEGEDEDGGERGLVPAQLLPRPRQHLQLPPRAGPGQLRLR